MLQMWKTGPECNFHGDNHVFLLPLSKSETDKVSLLVQKFSFIFFKGICRTDRPRNFDLSPRIRHSPNVRNSKSDRFLAENAQ